MTVPIIFIYGLGIIFFILGIEGEEGENKINSTNIIYLGLSFFINLIGYYISYQDLDYVQLAYLPMVLLILTILILIYKVWMLIPVSESWDSEAEKNED